MRVLQALGSGQDDSLLLRRAFEGTVLRLDKTDTPGAVSSTSRNMLGRLSRLWSPKDPAWIPGPFIRLRC